MLTYEQGAVEGCTKQTSHVSKQNMAFFFVLRYNIARIKILAPSRIFFVTLGQIHLMKGKARIRADRAV